VLLSACESLPVRRLNGDWRAPLCPRSHWPVRLARQMGNAAAVVRMVAQRSLGHWRLFAAMAVGAVLSAALMACVILYSDTVRDLGLNHALESQPRFATDIQVTSSSQRLSGREYEKLRTTTAELIQRFTSGFSSRQVRYGRSATFFPTAPGGTVSADEGRPRAHFQFQDDLAAHVRLVEGAAPAPLASASPDVAPTLEVWIGKEAATAHNIRVGQEFDLNPHWRKVAPFHAKVAGIIEPNDPKEAYWFGKTDRFFVNTANWPTFPSMSGR